MGLYTFKLPDVGEGTAEAELVAWKVKAGDQVAEDQPIADVMTDKATVELTAPVGGKVLETRFAAGDMVPVGSLTIVFEVEGAGNATEVPAAAPAAAPVSAPAPVAEAVSAPAPVASAPAVDGNFVFRLPDVGEGTAEAELVAWKVKVGDTVAEDQPLADVMTDKATVELTSPVAGVIRQLNGAPGQMVAVGSGIVVLQVEGKGNVTASAPVAAAPVPVAAPVSAPKAEVVAVKAPVKTVQPAAPQASLAPVVRGKDERPVASPAVRGRARDLGIELRHVPGTGPAGRITHEDLDAFIAQGGKPNWASGAASSGTHGRVARTEIEEIKVMGLRRQIANKMQESKRRIPHFAYVEEVDMTALEDLRVHMNATKRKDQPKLTVLPFFIRALAKLLPSYPQLNARFDDDAGIVYRYAALHCGLAVQTPAGLMVAVVRHAEALSIWDLATEILRVSTAAKEGKATREELTGSTITVTSLGPLGGIVTTPVINHPEVGIIGPNKIVERPMVKDGAVVIRKMMNISSSFDHRVVDGYDAAEFIQKLKGLLENPATLFMAE